MKMQLENREAYMGKDTIKEPFVVSAVEGGKFGVFHAASSTVVLECKTDEVAQEALVVANGCARKSRAAILKNIKEDTSEVNRNFYTKIADVLHPKVNIVSKFIPKPKSRESYGSAARQSFSANNVTAKEKVILEAIEKATKLKVLATPQFVADEIGVSVNVVNGAVSVLLAKGIVSSVRERGEKKAVRVFKIEYPGWAELVGKADVAKETKAKERKEAAEKHKADEKAKKEAKKAAEAQAKAQSDKKAATASK